ncbi:MAG TPA: helix-turn-helix domain-containing protein [Symbiobacteriaceae bacterium]|nr:helix-turn-helix domain-containing protein [Symbiobacteriaceae bacterium]
MPLFGTYLKHYRNEKGLSLRRLAEEIAVDPSILSRVERGEVANPSDELLEKLPQAIGRPRNEVYLAAGRITPELITVLEKGMPFLPEQTAKVLGMLEGELHPIMTAPGAPTLAEKMTPTDAATMSHIQSVYTTLGELAVALEQGLINQEQFRHAAELIRQLKLALLANPTEKETP